MSSVEFKGHTFFWRMHRRNDLRFVMVMYLDHLQNRLDLSHGLLIYLPLAGFRIIENGGVWGFSAFFAKKHEKNCMEFGELIDLENHQDWLNFSHGLLISLTCILYASWLDTKGIWWLRYAASILYLDVLVYVPLLSLFKCTPCTKINCSLSEFGTGCN